MIENPLDSDASENVSVRALAVIPVIGDVIKVAGSASRGSSGPLNAATMQMSRQFTDFSLCYTTEPPPEYINASEFPNYDPYLHVVPDF